MKYYSPKSRDILLAARQMFRLKLLTINAFPDAQAQMKMVVDSFQEGKNSIRRSQGEFL